LGATLAKYQAFLSYAHADENIAQRVHKSLETFPIPQALKTQGKLSPIFRDVTELTAHHSLSDKIRDAVQNSRFLIVLCSPSSKTSHWVNEEIRLFRQLHGEDSILCALIEGSPKTSFPPALTEGGREPLAADMTGQKESFKFGITQMAASMLGVGLDELVQREAKRRRRRLQFITAGALGFAAIMGGMAWTAVDARDAAEVSRTEAEKMVEFMITDLKDELEPVGRLSILDDVGTRVTDYYDAIPLSDMDDDRLARQARARHLLGQVALDQLNKEKAQSEIQASYDATKEVLRRNPDSEDAIYAHAQSAYWIGRLFYQSKNHLMALEYWEIYNNLCQSLYQKNPTNPDWILEASWGASNLGFIKIRLDKLEEAQSHLNQTISLNEELLFIDETNSVWIKELSNAYAGAANLSIKMSDLQAARIWQSKNINLLKKAFELSPLNKEIQFRLARSKIELDMPFRADTALDCNQTNISTYLDQLKEIIAADPENKIWQRNYSDYKNKYDSLCPR